MSSCPPFDIGCGKPPHIIERLGEAQAIGYFAGGLRLRLRLLCGCFARHLSVFEAPRARPAFRQTVYVCPERAPLRRALRVAKLIRRRPLVGAALRDGWKVNS